MSQHASDLDDLHFLELNEAILADPYPFFQRLRRDAPVYREPDYGVLVVSRYDDVVEVDRQADVFSNIDLGFAPYRPLPAPLDDLPQWRESARFADRIIQNDPPDHTRHRKVINRLFTPRRVAALEPRIRQLANELIDEFADDGEVEFVQHYANMLPRMVVGELLGVPPEDGDMLNDFFRTRLLTSREPSDDPKAEFRRMIDSTTADADPDSRTVVDYFAAAIKERRAHPREGDIMSEVANARYADGEEVPFTVLLMMIVLLYVAGGEANTTELLSNVVLTMLRHPEIEPRLRADPDLVDPYVEEVLRHETPLLGVFRVALRDTSVGGVPVAKGDIVMALHGSANRDESRYADPERFDLDRYRACKHAHLSFGYGAHFCPGAPLARLEGKVTTTEVLRRMRNLRFAEGASAVSYVPSVIQRIPARVHVAFDPSGHDPGR